MKELFEIAAEKIRLEGRKRPANMERRLVSLHTAHWQRRTKEQRTAYEMLASDHADSKWRTIEEDTLALHADIAVRKARIEEEAARRKPHTCERVHLDGARVRGLRSFGCISRVHPQRLLGSEGGFGDRARADGGQRLEALR